MKISLSITKTLLLCVTSLSITLTFRVLILLQRLYWFLLSFYIFPHLCFYYRHCLYFFVSHFFRLRRLFLFCLSPSITISLSFSVSLILFYVYLPVFQTLYLLFPPFVDLLVCHSSSSCLLVFLLLPLFPFSTMQAFFHFSLSLSISISFFVLYKPHCLPSSSASTKIKSLVVKRYFHQNMS